MRVLFWKQGGEVCGCEVGALLVYAPEICAKGTFGRFEICAEGTFLNFEICADGTFMKIYLYKSVFYAIFAAN